MDYQVNEDSSGTTVRISGNLDFAANEAFKSLVGKLAASKSRALTFDLANVSHIDSVGLGLLYIAKEEAGPSVGRIRLKSPQKGVLRLLQLTQADSDFEIQA